MESSYLVHYGVKGQKWGVRRYQNEDGSLTDKGMARYQKNKRYFDRNATRKALLGNPVSRSYSRSAQSRFAANVRVDAKKVDQSNKARREIGKAKALGVLGGIGSLVIADYALTGGQNVRAVAKATVTAGKVAVETGKAVSSVFKSKYGTVFNYAHGVEILN